MSILTFDLVKKAVLLAEPSVLKILDVKGATWGPKWVMGFVTGPGIETPINFQLGEEPKERWLSSWGDVGRFVEVAEKKLDVVIREGESTNTVVATRPWCLKEGEFLYPGGATRDGISVVASGAKGRADEAISEIILAAIRMLAFLKADKRIEKHEMQI